jgi:ABC-type antimicrobial peptide transport system permease subunit
MVLSQGARLAAVGLAVGVGGGLFLTTVLKSMVYGVSTTDPLAFGAVVLLLTGVALVASWIPARRAAGVDPMDVLRGS